MRREPQDSEFAAGKLRARQLRSPLKARCVALRSALSGGGPDKGQR